MFRLLLLWKGRLRMEIGKNVGRKEGSRNEGSKEERKEKRIQGRKEKRRTNNQIKILILIFYSLFPIGMWKIGTCGQPILGTKSKIDSASKELCYKGENMKHHKKNHE